jgi:dTDP-4-dehydrorhamnose reductase
VRVLIAGATGFLGSWLSEQLCTDQYDIFKLSKTSLGGTQVDCSRFLEISNYLDLITPDVIINAIGLADVTECELSPDKAYAVNVQSVDNIAAWMKAVQEKHRCHLIHISSDHIYCGDGPHFEDFVWPINYYALTKLAAETIAATVPSTTLRTNFFGPSLQKCGRKGIADWVIESARRDSQISVFDDVFFSPLSVLSVCEAIELVMAKPQTGVFNLGCRDGISKADFAFLLAREMALKTSAFSRRSIDVSTQSSIARPKDMRTDSTKFARTFGWVPPTIENEVKSMRVLYDRL